MAVGLWVALIAMGVAVVTYMYNLRNQAKMNLPPGPGALPVLGNLTVFMGKSKLLHHMLADLSNQYGPLIFLRLGSKPYIVASSPEVFREVFKHQDQVFASRPKTAAAELVANYGKGLGFSPYGEHWRQIRKVVTLELLTQKRVKQFESCRMTEASAMVTALVHHCETVHDSEKPVNLRLMLKTFGFNTMTQMAFSKRFYEYRVDLQHQMHPGTGTSTSPVNDPQLKEISAEEAKEFANLSQENVDLLAVNLIGDFIPYLSLLDRLTGIRTRMINSNKMLHHFLSRIVEEHKKATDQEKLDFLDVLLRLPGIDGSDHLDEITILAVCQDIVAGGTDTTSLSVEWLMAELIKHPDKAAKLMAELDAVVGKERLVTEADIPNLPYLQAVVHEGMRLHPIAALGVPHYSLQQTKVMGYDIPESTTVLANIWAVQRDPAIWDNPLQFHPERFLDKSEIDAKQQRCELLPFGAGRRGCPAMALSLITVQYVMARLFQAFEWSPPKGIKPEDLDMEEAFKMGLSSAHVLEAVPTTRLPFHLY